MTIVHGDALQVDLESATALFLYLVPQVRADQRSDVLCVWKLLVPMLLILRVAL